MDEEFTTLSKVQMSKMLSNKEKINEDAKVQQSEMMLSKVGANVIKRTKLPPGQKCEVIVEKGINKRFNNNINQSVNSSLQNSQSNNNNNNGMFSQSQSSNFFSKLPPELNSTFDKMIQQLDIVVKTMKIMDQRIQTVENQVGELYSMKKAHEDIVNKSEQQEGDVDINDNNNNNEEEEGNVPVEIFEDVGNHVEDLNNAVEE
jgi:hypothetical protein